MDWLGIFSLIVSVLGLIGSVLVVPLLRREIFLLIPDISRYLIKKATSILPSGCYQDRYEEEFLERIEKYNGRFCQLMCAISCSWACVKILKQLLDQFNGLSQYKYEASTEDISAKGFCTLKPTFLNGTLFVSGELKTISETDGREGKVCIPWQSTQIQFLDMDRIQISYEILDLNSNWIQGHFIGRYSKQQGFSGYLYRKLKSDSNNKYEQLRFKAKRTNTKSAHDSRVQNLVNIYSYFNLLVYLVKQI